MSHDDHDDHDDLRFHESNRYEPAYARLAVGTTLTSPFVVLFWWFTVNNPWVMDRAELFPLAFLITFILGPSAGLGVLLCGRLLYCRGLSSAWYALPCALLGSIGFIVNFLAFVFLIAPAC